MPHLKTKFLPVAACSPGFLGKKIDLTQIALKVQIPLEVHIFLDLPIPKNVSCLNLLTFFEWFSYFFSSLCTVPRGRFFVEAISDLRQAVTDRLRAAAQ